MWTRQAIEDIKQVFNRPRVRVKYDCTLVDEDGNESKATKETTGAVIVDGNNPWIEIHAAGQSYAERFSWGLVCEVLNDRFSPPIYFSEKGIIYEI